MDLLYVIHKRCLRQFSCCYYCWCCFCCLYCIMLYDDNLLSAGRGSHRPGPGKSSSLCWRRHNDQAVGARQAGILKQFEHFEHLEHFEHFEHLEHFDHFFKILGRRQDWWADWQKHGAAGDALYWQIIVLQKKNCRPLPRILRGVTPTSCTLST